MTEAPPPAVTPEGTDPSMEDILASIRRILNEEETPADADAPDAAPADDDVLVLDHSMMVPTTEPVQDEPDPEPEPLPPATEVAPPVARTELSAESKPPRQEMAALATGNTDPAEPPRPSPELMAPETAAAAASLVGNLVRTLTAGRSLQVYAGGPTVEDVVRAELRPLLKEWLDTNLSPIVERLVRTEIERVVGRAAP